MRRLHFTLFLAVFCVFIGVAQDNESESGEKDIRPVITFEKNTHDFGKIEYNKGGTCNFIFRNTGEKPLIITAVWASCGCSTPLWPKAPIESGKTDTVKVTYDTRIKGSFSKSIRVHSNANNSPNYLRIKGEVLSQEKK